MIADWLRINWRGFGRTRGCLSFSEPVTWLDDGEFLPLTPGHNEFLVYMATKR